MKLSDYNFFVPNFVEKYPKIKYSISDRPL
jgi:hypothetical protein